MSNLLKPHELDEATQEELRRFWQLTHTGARSAARELFPDRPKGFCTATKDLGAYAANKVVARNLRLKGDIAQALEYEGICERIYNSLPDFARW